MPNSIFFPLPDGLNIDAVVQEGGCLTIAIRSTCTHVPCPFCQSSAERVHSRYQRVVADVSCGGQSVRLHLTVRKFFCHNTACAYTLFAERFPGFVRAYARMTERLVALIQAIGLATTGEGGARLAQILALPTSPDTLLRRILALPLPEDGPVTVVGIDDWAWHKGQRYGSIVVDLERHRVVALLEERTSEVVCRWLQSHPEIHVVCRDRGSVYIEGATLGAPQAVQIADRWHILHNVCELTEQVLERHRSALHVVYPLEEMPAAEWHAPLVKRDEAQRVARRAHRYAAFERVLALDRQGWGNAQIAREVGLSVRSVSRYLTAQHFPERYRRKRRSRLDPYLPYLRQRWEQGCHNARHLWRELQQQGFGGSLALVSSYVACLRHPDLLQRPEVEAVVRRSYLPRKAVWLFLRKPEHLTPLEHQDLAQMQTNCPELTTLYVLVQAFHRLMTQRQGEALPAWMDEARASGLPELRRFADGIEHDLAAIRAALCYEWSSGQVEGQINRLKTRKRQMFGRAKFPLLARHMLLAA